MRKEKEKKILIKDLIRAEIDPGAWESGCFLITGGGGKGKDCESGIATMEVNYSG